MQYLLSTRRTQQVACLFIVSFVLIAILQVSISTAHASVPGTSAYLGSAASGVIEPHPSSSNNYDKYLEFGCGPGSMTAALAYWGITRTGYANYYRDPSGNYYYSDTNYNGYIEYLAVTKGVMNFSGDFSPAQTMVNVLNSIVGQGYYGVAWYSGGTLTSESVLKSHIQSDLYKDGRPDIVSVNDDYLPDWKGNGLSHYVAITGFNLNAGTVQYYETYDYTNTQGAGFYTISFDQLWKGITDDNGNGALIW